MTTNGEQLDRLTERAAHPGTMKALTIEERAWLIASTKQTDAMDETDRETWRDAPYLDETAREQLRTAHQLLFDAYQIIEEYLVEACPDLVDMADDLQSGLFDHLKETGIITD